MDEDFDSTIDWVTFEQARTELGASFIRILGYFREDAEKAVSRIEEAMHRGDAVALVPPAQKLTEARHFGADHIADIAEEIELAGRRAIESRVFPDHLVPEVARLRPLYFAAMELFERRTNPLVARRPSASRAANNQDFGRI